MTRKRITVLDEDGGDVIILEVAGEFEILKMTERKAARVLID